jgi:hypothetical protein
MTFEALIINFHKKSILYDRELHTSEELND